ncbi:MAG: EAL domain-containing protein [Rhodospirillaceae bacterium]|nr:EAL domain-containing protein [Rhodospirillaceae bacterium]
MMKETVVWMKRIKQTIAKDNFELVYQPIVSLGDGSVHHYEALTRLPEDNGGSPFKFITMAEQLGNIGEFDFAVFKRVARIIRTGEPGPDASIAVNLSGRSLSTPGFVETLIAFLKTDLRIRKQIVFEITESSKIDDLQTVNKMVQAIRDMKIAVCLDDFGVGCPSSYKLGQTRS